jgi:hypothetical protein
MSNSFSAALPVLTPVLFAIIVELVFLRALKRRDGKIEFSELGVLFSGVILVYTLYPCLTFLASGLEFTAASDNRLYVANPSPAELAPIFWYYVLYLTSFAVAYVHFRGNTGLKRTVIIKPGPRLIWVLVAGYLFIRLFFFYLRVAWNIRSPESYGEEYLLFRNLPLFFQQLANHFGWMSLTIELLLMAALTLNYKKYKVFIFGWLVAEFAGIAVSGVGSRTGLMMALLTLVITYHLFVKRFTRRAVWLLWLAGLLLFLGLGMIRMFYLYSSDEAVVSLVASRNEFETLFANAYDLRELKATGQTEDIFPGLYFSDVANLIPQQIMPFKKIDLGEWYVQTFYDNYTEGGGGFGFGAISESIVGLGWIDLIWRGFLVGWIFAWIYRRFSTEKMSFWNYSFYLWVTIFSYQTFRTTTFILVPHVIYDVLPVMVAANLLSKGDSRRSTTCAKELTPETT